MRKYMILIFPLLFVNNSTSSQFKKSTPIVFSQSATGLESVFHLEQANDQKLEISVEIPQVDTMSIQIGNARFKKIWIQNFSQITEIGKPALPVIGQLIMVPLNAQVTVEIRPSKVLEIQNVDVLPASEPAADHQARRKFIKDQQTYSADKYFPGNSIWTEPLKIIRGYPVTILWFAPVQYNPVKRTLRIYSEAIIEVSFSGGDGFGIQSKYSSPVFSRMLANLAINWPAITMNILNEEPGQRYGQDECDYLIITHEKFEAAADSLALWRKLCGLRTKVELIKNIGSTAEDIQYYIQEAYDTWNPAPTYVLLLGDVEYLPTSYVNLEGATVMELVASDLHYVTVDGEDYFPDISIGRISVDTFVEAVTFVRQVINYERNPVNDPSFYSHAAVAAQFQDQSDSNKLGVPDGYEDRRFVLTSEEIRDFLLSKGYSVTRIYEAEPSVNPTHYNNTDYANGESLPQALLRSNGFEWDANSDEIIRIIEKGCFLLTHRDHATPEGWSHPQFLKSAVENLKNFNRLPVVFSINCSSGWFDNEIYGMNSSESFAETWLRNSNGGAVGVFAATRTSLSGYNDALVKGFIDAIWPQFLPSIPGETEPLPQHLLGSVLNSGKLYLATRYPESDRRQFAFLEYHYLGDPASSIWAQAPRTFTVRAIEPCFLGQARLVVELSEADATVTLLQNSEILATASSNNQGIAVLTFPPIDSYQPIQICIHKPDFRPFITLLGVQNHSGTCLITEMEKFRDENQDEEINIGERIHWPIRIKNSGTVPVEDISVRLSCPDTFITLIDSVVKRECLLGGETLVVTALSFKVKNSCPHRYQTKMDLDVKTASDYKIHYGLDLTIVEGAPALQVSHQMITPKVTAVNDSTEMRLTLVNCGFGILELSTKIDADDECWIQCPRLAVKLGHNESKELPIKFWAVKADTQFSTLLRLTSNVPNQAEILIPIHFFVGQFDFHIITGMGRFIDHAGNNDNQINPGEKIILPITLKNIGTGTASHIRTTIESDDPHIFVLDRQEIIAYIEGGDSVTLDAFEFEVSNRCPDKHNLNFGVRFNVNEMYDADSEFSAVITEANPIIEVEPASLSASVAGLNDSLSMSVKITNQGYGKLIYSFENPLYSEKTVCSPATNVWLARNDGAGNVYQFNRSFELGAVQCYFKIDSNASICFFVYAGDSLLGDYYLLTKKNSIFKGPGEGWCSAGDLNCILLAGKYYYIGTSWSGVAQVGMSSVSLPNQFWAGHVTTGTLTSVASPPLGRVCQRFSRFQALAQRLIESEEKAWLDFSLLRQELFPQETAAVLFKFCATHPDTIFRANIGIECNAPENTIKYLPVMLTVGNPAVVTGNQSTYLPLKVELQHNYPNPFNLTTKVNYVINRATHIEISVYNILGQNVFTLVKQFQQPGFYEESWNGCNHQNNTVPSGVYFIILKTAGITIVKKMLLLK